MGVIRRTRFGWQVDITVQGKRYQKQFKDKRKAIKSLEKAHKMLDERVAKELIAELF